MCTMPEGAHARDGDPSPARPVTPAPTGRPAVPPLAAGALALQRAAGNRAARQAVARWAAHPDQDKKGVLMPDPMAQEFVRFNPPLSK